MNNLIKITIISLLAVMFLFGCSSAQDSSGTDVRSGNSGSGSDVKVCTQDVKECPDGSFVARVAENNCEFAPCPKAGDDSGSDSMLDNSGLSAEVKALQDKARNLKSYEYLSENTGNYLQVKGDTIVLKLRDPVYLKSSNFRYNTVYFVDSKAYGYCFTDSKYSNFNCDTATLKSYVEVDYDTYYPKEFAIDWILDLDNGEVINSVTCENRQCDIIEFSKDDQTYRMEVRQTYGFPYKVSEIDDEGTQKKVALFTDVAFNHLKDSEMIPPGGYELIVDEE
ncbi:hypothetical protein H6503_06455 [Candidatus Woesearchaeota archaeon]|nr:hypothetical protein [Candidatus Woesearchaeota archaeon]